MSEELQLKKMGIDKVSSIVVEFSPVETEPVADKKEAKKASKQQLLRETP